MFWRTSNSGTYRLLQTVPLLCVLCRFCYSADEAHQLQTQAIQRIENYVSNFRKTADLQTLAPELGLAETELIRSTQLFLATGDNASVALNLCKLGDIERLLSRWQQSKELYNQAYAVAKKVNHTGYQAKAKTGLARCESLGLHDYGAAAASAREAIQLSKECGDKKNLCESLSILTGVLENRGELTAAADTAQQELQAATEMNDEIQLLFAHLDVASAAQALGSKCDNNPAFGSFTSCYAALQTAEETYKQAMRLAQELGYNGLITYITPQLQSAQMKRQLIQARESSQIHVEESKFFNPLVPSDVLVTEAFSVGGAQDPKITAFLSEAHTEAVRQAEAHGFPLGPSDLYGKGLLASMQGHQDVALKFYLRAADLLESDREKLQDDKGRGTFLSDKIDIYYHPLLEFLQLHRYPEAFNMLERSRSRAFADLLGSKPLHFSNPQEQNLYARLMTIDANTAKRQAELYSLRAQDANDNSAQRIAIDEEEISKLESERRAILNQTANSAPKLQSLVVAQPVSLAELQESMRQEKYEALYYLVLDTATIVWHISADSVEVKNVFLPHFELVKKVAALRESLADPANKFDDEVARQMFLFLVQPVLPYIHSKRLVIFPQEELNYVPFQVFEDPASKSYFGEQYQLCYAPSATVLLKLKHEENIAKARLLAVADPDLPEAGREVDAIAHLYPVSSKVLKDRLPTKREFTAQTSSFDVIHVAAHGKFDATEPMLSYVALREAAPDDGKLTAAEMFGLPLQNARLVVLSACETGRGQATHANEVQGILRGLLYAGANNLILSSWKVDSASTALWMQTFYREAQTQTLPEAARRASIVVKTSPQYSHPYYWAPFIFIGK